MGLNGVLLNTQITGDLAIGASRENLIEHLPLPVSQASGGVGQAGFGGRKQPVD
jgi:hypothetical protein